MKHTIKNLINSPYNAMGVDGVVHIPAGGEVTAEFTKPEVLMMKQVGYFVVTEAGSEVKRDPLDHDGNGIKGGSLPVEKRGPGRPKKSD